MVDILNRDNLSDQVSRYLQEHIRRHGLRPGDPLPSEIELSKDLGVSRGIVREAFRGLAATGLVNVVSGRRAHVGHLTNRALTQLFDHATVTEQVHPSQVLELRRAVEVGAAQLAARHATPAHLAAMREALQQMHAHANDSERFVAHDVAFHVAVADATGNLLFHVLVTSVRSSIENSILAGLRSRHDPRAMGRILELHDLIVAAIAAGEPAEAARAMDLHFDEAITAILAEGLMSERTATTRPEGGADSGS